jgi:hypothetical protein
VVLFYFSILASHMDQDSHSLIAWTYGQTWSGVELYQWQYHTQNFSISKCKQIELSLLLVSMLMQFVKFK